MCATAIPACQRTACLKDSLNPRNMDLFIEIVYHMQTKAHNCLLYGHLKMAERKNSAKLEFGNKSNARDKKY